MRLLRYIIGGVVFLAGMAGLVVWADRLEHTENYQHVLQCPEQCERIGMVVHTMNLTDGQCVCAPVPPAPKCDKAWERTDDVLTLYSSCREALNVCQSRLVQNRP